MPFGGLLSLGVAGISAGTSLAGLFGGSPADNVQLPQQFQMPYMGQSAQNAYEGIGQLGQYNVPAQLLPQYQQIAQQSINNPYANFYQQGANQAGGIGIQAGQNAYGAGGQITDTSLAGLPNVQALLSMGFDPQNALYNRTSQQVQEQTRAAEAARGIQNTPYGAGVEGNTMSNFNIDWQNNALSRATQGAQGASSLLGGLTSGAIGGSGLQGAAAGQVQQGAGTPYNTFQGINANALGTLGQLGQFGAQGAALPQQQIGDYLAYLGQGTSQQGANNQTGQLGLNQANLGFNQNQTLGGQFGSSLAGLASAYGKTGWGGNSNVWGSGAASGGNNGGAVWGF